MVQLKEMHNMFWALVLESGKRYSQKVEQSFHISMAALEIPNDPENLKSKHHQTVAVMIANEKSDFLICSLNYKGKTQQTLDLNFNEGEEVTFFINGPGTVHLTGYHLDDEGDFEDDLMEGLDEEEGEEESDDEAPKLVTPKRKRGLEPNVSKKKTKWLTPGGTEFSDEDEDDDSEDDDDSDDDFIDKSDLLDMEAEEGEEDEDESDMEEDSEDESDDSDEEESKVQQKKTPKQDKSKQLQQQQKQTPKHQDKKHDKQTPKPETKTPKQEQGKTPKQETKTPKQEQGKTPKLQEKKDQDKKQTGGNTPGPKQTGTPASTPGPGGDAMTQSAKKKKKKKKKKHAAENGEASPSKPESQPQQQNTPKPSQNQQQAKTPNQQIKTPKKQVLAGGTISEEIKMGEGPIAKKGQMAHVYYVGKLQKDGKQFDSCTSGKPFRFKLGLGEVIQGWDKGVEGMKVGGKRRLTVPPGQAYGNQRSGPIPPGSTLVFEVELKKVS